MAATDTGEFAIKVSNLITDLDRAATDTHCDDTAHEQDQFHQSVLRDNLDRFKLWAGSLGAFHSSSDPRSLEHRLRKAPQVRSRVHDLLAALTRSLLEILREPGGNTEGAIGEQQIVTNTQDELDLLDMLGLTENDSMETCGKVSHICHKISEDISYLFKVSALIGKSIARDRYARAETASKERFDNQYDVAHVKAKFQQQKAPDWLLVRLGQAITKRRQYLKYVREHRSRIDYNPLQSRKLDLLASSSPVDPLQVKASPKAVTLASRPSQMPTLATTVLSNVLLNVEQTFEDDQSVTTANTTWLEDDPGQKLSVPLLTDYTMFGREFQCPFCPTTTKFSSQTSWKRHVHADLRAYLCTHEECGMAMFEQKRAWIDHEMEKHWRSWFCYLCKFNSDQQSELAIHLGRHHPETLNEGPEHAMTYMTSRPLDYLDASRCPLCDWDKLLSSKGSITTVSRASFMGHLAHHLEQLALFAIPRAISDEDFDSLGTNHAANHSSQISQSIESSSSVQAEASIQSAIKTGPTKSSSPHTHESLSEVDSKPVSLVTISQAFPSEPQDNDTTVAWMTRTEDHNAEIVTSHAIDYPKITHTASQLFPLFRRTCTLCNQLLHSTSKESWDDAKKAINWVLARLNQLFGRLPATPTVDPGVTLALDSCVAIMDDLVGLSEQLIRNVAGMTFTEEIESLNERIAGAERLWTALRETESAQPLADDDIARDEPDLMPSEGAVLQATTDVNVTASVIDTTTTHAAVDSSQKGQETAHKMAEEMQHQEYNIPAQLATTNLPEGVALSDPEVGSSMNTSEPVLIDASSLMFSPLGEQSSSVNKIANWIEGIELDVTELSSGFPLPPVSKDISSTIEYRFAQLRNPQP